MVTELLLNIAGFGEYTDIGSQTVASICCFNITLLVCPPDKTTSSSIVLKRQIEPEILDTLAFNDSRAIANRRDLRILNHLMGNFKWFSRELSSLTLGPSILELGAGDGSLGLYLLHKEIIAEQAHYQGIDLWPRPSRWPGRWQWRQEDLRTTIPNPTTNCLIANMIFHQFTDDEIRCLIANVESSSIKHIFICEPLRQRRYLWLLPIIRLLGMNSVTLHDARVSIRAGFRDLEACSFLGLDPDLWSFNYQNTLLGANRLICHRK